jgi:hypothetical protein
MMWRCYNKNSKSYGDYGGRGIKVTKRWHKFENFYFDMGDPPEGMSIERVNNNNGYSKTNCRWATAKEQVRNTRASKLTVEKAVEIIKDINNGLTYKKVCKKFGIKSTGHVYLIVKGRLWPEALEKFKRGVL